MLEQFPPRVAVVLRELVKRTFFIFDVGGGFVEAGVEDRNFVPQRFGYVIVDLGLMPEIEKIVTSGGNAGGCHRGRRIAVIVVPHVNQGGESALLCREKIVRVKSKVRVVVSEKSPDYSAL